MPVQCQHEGKCRNVLSRILLKELKQPPSGQLLFRFLWHPKGLSWLYKALPWLSHMEDRCGSTSLIKMFVLREDQKTEPWQRLKRSDGKRSVYQIVQHWRDKRTFELISLHNVISYMKLDCQIQLYKMQGESKRTKRRMNTQGTNHCHSHRSAWQTKN